MQKIATNGWRGSNWPVNSTAEYEKWNLKRNKIMNDFLTTGQYKEVWESDGFKIFVPASPGIGVGTQNK
jgi:hypothetical protein